MVAGDSAASPAEPTVFPTKALSMFDNRGLHKNIPKAGMANPSILRLEDDEEEALATGTATSGVVVVVVLVAIVGSSSIASKTNSNSGSNRGSVLLILLSLLLSLSLLSPWLDRNRHNTRSLDVALQDKAWVGTRRVF